MKIDELGEVGAVLTESNEPILAEGDQVIGFRQLHYTAYRGRFLSKSVLVAPRTGWCWQTRRRLLLLDDAWVNLPGGKRGKRYHEIPNEESVDVVHKKRRVLLHAQDGTHGRITFEFRPFGAASRLLAWLKAEKEHRRKREVGALASPYRAQDREGPPGRMPQR